MKNEARRERARQTAESYAPKPRDGYIMYVSVGIGLSFLALIALGTFYDIDYSIRWIEALVAVALACSAAAILRRVRLRRHDEALRTEYDLNAPGRESDPNSAEHLRQQHPIKTGGN
jgi:hypothetical protein